MRVPVQKMTEAARMGRQLLPPSPLALTPSSMILGQLGVALSFLGGCRNRVRRGKGAEESVI
jgi:hypothetical protein